MNLMTEHARELLGMPPEWNGYEFEAIGHIMNYETNTLSDAKLFRVRGAVAPLITRGSYKGCLNWKKRDKTTDKTTYFTPEEHKQWLKRWEDKTGLCSKCEGKGEVFLAGRLEMGLDSSSARNAEVMEKDKEMSHDNQIIHGARDH